MERISQAEWAQGRAARQEAAARVRAFFGDRPYRRTRPRDAQTAEVLRQLGVTEELIGPVASRSSDER
jgi:hypothetical protein